MEDWKMWAFWTALGFNLVAGAWNLVAAIRRDRKAARLDQAAWGAGLLPSADSLAPLPGAADDEAARRETTEWLAQAMNEMRASDQAVLADKAPTLRAWDGFFRVWGENRSRDEALIEAARQRQQRLQALHQAVREKALPLLRLQAAELDVQGLLSDLDALGEVIQGTAEGPCSPSGK